jgi:hypothetical protein
MTKRGNIHKYQERFKRIQPTPLLDRSLFSTRSERRPRPDLERLAEEKRERKRKKNQEANP